MMSRRLAPRARRMPISRVRSVTVASMMFMMPMPPTRSEIEAIVPRMMLNCRAVRRACSSKVVGNGHLDVLLRVVRLVGRVDQRRPSAVTSSIEPTWIVICVSCVSSALNRPSGCR